MLTATAGPGMDPVVSGGGDVWSGDLSSLSVERQECVRIAKTLVGGRYVYGGINPETGLDCSGLTRYVIYEATGITLEHHSATQAQTGREVSRSEMRPGDIIAYDGDDKDGSVNHVGLYIGNGKIIHAASSNQGVIESEWDYSTPFAIRNVLGD